MIYDATKASRAKWQEILFILAVGTLVACVVALGLLDGSRSFFNWPDARDQTYAWSQKLAQCWHAGYLPLWDANTFSGHSFVGEFQAGVFYPLNWLWMALFAHADGISLAALEAFVVLHFFIAASGMALLLRHWQLGRLASAGGAFIFALLGPVAMRAAAQPNIFFGLCLLPWALYFASRHLESGKVRYAVIAGTVVALQILAGHVQPAFHTALMIAAMVFAHHWRTQPDAWRALVATLRSGLTMAVTLLLVSAPQWILSLQYMSDAYRWVGADAPVGPGQHVPYEVFAFKSIVRPGDLPNLIDPWRFGIDDANVLYVGTVTLWLIGWFLASRERRSSSVAWRQHGVWLSTVALFGAIVIFGHYTIVPDMLRTVPLVGQIRELGRYVILLHVTACVLAACAIDALWSARARFRLHEPRTWIALLLTLLVLVCLWFGRTALSTAAIGALMLTLLASLSWHVFGSGRAAAVISVTALLITAHLFARLVVPDAHAAPTATEAFAAPGLVARLDGTYGRDRILIEADTQLPSNFTDAHRLQSVDGHAATSYRPYFDFRLRDWSLKSEVYDLLNVRYVLSRSKLDLPMVAADSVSGIRIYERPNAYSRIFLASQYGATPALRRAKFDILQYDDHTQRFRIHTLRAEQAIVSEIAYPGWCARVNGKPVRIDKAKLGGVETPLRAVMLSAGDNEIEFRYRPYYALAFGCD